MIMKKKKLKVLTTSKKIPFFLMPACRKEMNGNINNRRKDLFLSIISPLLPIIFILHSFFALFPLLLLVLLVPAVLHNFRIACKISKHIFYQHKQLLQKEKHLSARVGEALQLSAVHVQLLSPY